MLERSGRKHLTVSWYLPSTEGNYDRQIASVWIRCLQLIPYLETYGISCHLNLLSRVPDVAIFLRRYSIMDVAAARFFKLIGTKVVVDVVANYYEPLSNIGKGVGVCTSKQRTAFLKMHEYADEVWCVSPYLTEQASSYHGQAYFVSDSIDLNHFNQVKADFPKNRPLRLGWSGVAAKSQDLNLLAPLLKEKSCELLVVSDRNPQLQVPYIYRPWSHARFPHDIVECDLCVAPRTIATEYDRSHSLFKVGVFMSEGVPVVASPVPSYRLVLTQGDSGLLCEDIDGMLGAIRDCIDDRDRLIGWSAGARERIAPYSSAHIAEQVAMRLHSLVGFETEFKKS